MHKRIFILLTMLVLSLSSCQTELFPVDTEKEYAVEQDLSTYYDTDELYVDVNQGLPNFTEEDLQRDTFEEYSELDSLGRCGVAFACLSKELMPIGEREAIGHVRPTGWQTVKYDCVDGNYLYNRCHLIGYQLAGENDNEKNLVTGTRQMNVDGMLPFENKIADYISTTNNHVLYRVTPIFEGQELVCRGVHIEAQSIEDDTIEINVFCPNRQRGVEIDYLTGSSHLKDENSEETQSSSYQEGNIPYILNTKTKKYHLTDCPSVRTISEDNKETFNGTKTWLDDNGYTPCGNCHP